MAEGVYEVSFIRVPTLFMRVLPSWHNQFPKTLFPNIITLGIRSPRMNFGGEGTQTFSLLRFSSVQLSHSVMSCSLRPHGLQASLSITNSRSLLKLMSIESVMPSNHLILRCPLLLPPSIFPSIRVFSNELALHIRWPKYWISDSASVLLLKIQDWFPLGLTSWISLQSKGFSRVFSNTTVQKHQFFSAQLSL